MQAAVAQAATTLPDRPALVLTGAFGDGWQPLDGATFTSGGEGGTSESWQFQMPARIVPGEPFMMSGSVQLAQDCAAAGEDAEAGATVEVQAFVDLMVFEGSADQVGKIAASSSASQACGAGDSTQRVEAAVHTTWTPQPATDGSTSLRYVVESDGGDRKTVVLHPPDSLIFVINLPRFTFVYEATDAPPLPLAAAGGTTSPAERNLLINEWLAIAEPPENATDGADLHYDEWGRTVGTTRSGTLTASGPPAEAGSTPASEWVWGRRNELDSVAHCTLSEYVERKLAGGAIDDCGRRYSRSASPPTAEPEAAGEEVAAADEDEPREASPPEARVMTEAQRALSEVRNWSEVGLPDRTKARTRYARALRLERDDAAKSDYPAARELFEKAARTGYAKAQYRLGRMYENGLAVEANLGVALAWYRLAAAQGNPEAKLAVARLERIESQ